MKKLILILSLVVVTVLLLTVVSYYIPFGFEDMKYVESYHLRNCVMDYQLQSKPELYNYTNRMEAVYLFKTNIVIGSNVYPSIMRLDSLNFRNSGYLLATTNRKVYWIGVNGRSEELK